MVTGSGGGLGVGVGHDHVDGVGPVTHDSRAWKKGGYEKEVEKRRKAKRGRCQTGRTTATMGSGSPRRSREGVGGGVGPTLASVEWLSTARMRAGCPKGLEPFQDKDPRSTTTRPWRSLGAGHCGGGCEGGVRSAAGESARAAETVGSQPARARARTRARDDSSAVRLADVAIGEPDGEGMNLVA